MWFAFVCGSRGSKSGSRGVEEFRRGSKFGTDLKFGVTLNFGVGLKCVAPKFGGL